MSEAHLAIADFYDHESETTTRSAPDWGGDDLFTQPPPRRRRFERTQYPARLRDSAHDHIEPARPAHPAEPFAAPAAPAPAIAETHVEPDLRDRYMEPVAPGRRTVTITGRPEGYAPRRPPRTFDEHIAHRPERIASWTCGLGFLSIVLAIVTAQ